MAKTNTYDICLKHLYDDVTKIEYLAPQLRDKLLRIRSGYTMMLEFPNRKDREIILHLQQFFGIDKSAAYEDLKLIKDLLGAVNKQSKDWHRFNFNNKFEKTFNLAELKQNTDSMAKALNVYGKYNQLDKEDIQQFPWEDLKPQLFEPVSDPTVLGIKPMPNFRETIAAMKKKYLQDAAEDVTYEEVDLTNLEYASTGEI